MNRCYRMGVFYLLTIIVGSFLTTFVDDVAVAFAIGAALVLVLTTPMIAVAIEWLLVLRVERQRKRNFPSARIRRN